MLQIVPTVFHLASLQNVCVVQILLWDFAMCVWVTTKTKML